jgi:hypothetical protein
MGYASLMQTDILGLLDLFQDRVPDSETHAWLRELAASRANWGRGQHVFGLVRGRSAKSRAGENDARTLQYYFEEACLKSLYNVTGPSAPFDPESPYFIIKRAMMLANVLGIPIEDVAAVVAPRG